MNGMDINSFKCAQSYLTQRRREAIASLFFASFAFLSDRPVSWGLWKMGGSGREAAFTAVTANWLLNPILDFSVSLSSLRESWFWGSSKNLAHLETSNLEPPRIIAFHG